MTVSAPPPSSNLIPAAPGNPAGATPQPGWRPSGSSMPSPAAHPQARSARSSVPTVAAGLPVPQAASDLPAAVFAAVLSGLSQPEPPAQEFPKNAGQPFPVPPVGPPLPRAATPALAAPATAAAPTGARSPLPALAVPIQKPADPLAPGVAGASTTDTPVVAPAAGAASTSPVVPALPVVLAMPVAPAAAPAAAPAPEAPSVPAAPAIAPPVGRLDDGTAIRVSSGLPIRTTASHGDTKPSGFEALAPHAREAPGLNPPAFDPQAAPGASMHAPSAHTSSADPAKEADTPGTGTTGNRSARSAIGFPEADAREVPTGTTVSSPAAGAPHPIAFAARLVERPPTVETQSPAPDPEAPPERPAEMAALRETAIPDLPASPALQASRIMPELPAKALDAPPLAKSADPSAPKTPAETPAPASRREGAENPTLPPKAVRPDGAENDHPAAGPRETDSPHATAGAPLLAAPGKSDETTEGRAASSAAAESGPAADRAPAAAQAWAAPREPAAASPAQNISVRVSSDGHPALEVRVMDRGGEVRVAVHSADPATSESVRSGLPDLVDRLVQHGYETEIWRPPAAPPSTSTRGESNGSRHGQQDQAGAGQQQRQRQPQPEWLEELDSHLNATNQRSALSWRP